MPNPPSPFLSSIHPKEHRPIIQLTNFETHPVMSDENENLSDAESTKQIAVDAIWDLLDCDSVIVVLVAECHGINAIAVRKKLVPPQDPDAGPMPVGFVYFVSKDPRDKKLESRVECVAWYISEIVINNVSPF